MNPVLTQFPLTRWPLLLAGGSLMLMLGAWGFQYIGGYEPCALCLDQRHIHLTVIALGLIFGGWNMIWLALRSRMLPQQASADVLVARNSGDDRPFDAGLHDGAPDLQAQLGAGAPAPAKPPSGAQPPLTVHVWTPAGSAKGPARRQPLIDRYIAAVDNQGVISTGHAALEILPELYISLYPAEEIDRSPDQFARLLRATADNDVKGRYLTDYRSEAAAWCESTEKIVFRDYRRASLDRFWQHYRQTEIYNLTYRNCSSTVAHALEAALEGVIGGRDRHWFNAVRMMFTPEIWVASQIRKRAVTMAWTPGMVLDYARALRAVVHPRPLSWAASLHLALRQSRRLRKAWRTARRQADVNSTLLDKP